MKVIWLQASQRDLVRLYDFLRDVAPATAARNIQTLLTVAEKLTQHPRIGHVCDDYAPREVRSLISGDYEMRYEVLADRVVILRVWHTREDR
jgi:plasmid stabilization system protein ParE